MLARSLHPHSLAPLSPASPLASILRRRGGLLLRRTCFGAALAPLSPASPLASLLRRRGGLMLQRTCFGAAWGPSAPPANLLLRQHGGERSVNRFPRHLTTPPHTALPSCPAGCGAEHTGPRLAERRLSRRASDRTTPGSGRNILRRRFDSDRREASHPRRSDTR
ncbi:hypothetical protein Taro_000407 [Colocasia esculenta]|uniref:Uncharacterized protein n=1 Tax=Colocasia esculenta TaxID=4460 RepID=A0A843TF46_COLES|nr:hypothetical protein [Colocasia esculenta]